MKLSVATLLLTLIGLLGLIVAEGPAKSLITGSDGTEEVEEYLQNVEKKDELFDMEGLSDGEGLSDEDRELFHHRRRRRHHYKRRRRHHHRKRKKKKHKKRKHKKRKHKKKKKKKKKH